MWQHDKRVAVFFRRSRDRVRNRSQLVVKRRRFDDFSFSFQFVEDFLPHLEFVILILALRRQRPRACKRQENQKRNTTHEYG